MTTRQNPYPLRVEKIIMEKFKVVAADNARSVNKEIEMLMRIAIKEYESTHGEITVDLDA
ncbi:MAG: hypothetical protein RR444_10460 [Oscillospiraceae bacterium]